MKGSRRSSDVEPGETGPGAARGADGGHRHLPGIPAEFLAAIIDSVAHPIFVKDREFRFVLLNRALSEMVGHPREQMLGGTDYDFFPREEADFFREKDEELFETGAVVDVEEETITDASGRLHVLSTTKVPLRDDAGEVTHLVGIIHDITRLKAAEEELRLANEDLEGRVAARTAELVTAQERLLRGERLAVIGQISGGLAHQIRNPLGAISNAAFLLRRGLRDHPEPELRRAVEIVIEEATAANKIITGLVTHARIRPPDLDKVEVTTILDRALSISSPPAGVAVLRDLPMLPPVAVDVGQVASAVANLVDNAVDAMGGRGVLSFRSRQVDGGVELTVEDTGPGVDPEVRERLFEPLVTAKPLGLGLGLTTARSLIERQGGELTCLRSGREGTAFRLLLPVRDQGGQ